MRVLVTTFPGKGHFHPVAPLALELQARGHEVIVATGADLTEWVGACGLRTAPAGLTQEAAVRTARRDVPPNLPLGVRMFAAAAAAPMLDDLRELTRRWRPDLIVHEEAEYAAPLLAATLEVPCVTHSWPAPVLPPPARADAEELLTPLWEAAAVEPARTIGDLYLDSCPPPLQTDDIAALPHVVRVRPTVFDGPPPVARADLDGLPRPLAYVTLGTVPEFARPGVMRTAVVGAASSGASVVLTSGPVAPETLARLAANVQVRSYLPQGEVLAIADVVVSHGGAGATVGALLHGLPHLVLPQGAPSQQRCADQVTRLGAGIALPASEQTVAAVAAAVSALLTDPTYGAAAARVARSLDPLPPPAAVADELVARFA